MDRPLGLIVFATKENWPVIHHIAARQPMHVLAIVPTKPDDRTREVERLAKFCLDTWSIGCSTVVLDELDPEKMLAKVRAKITEDSLAGYKWCVNANGGSKLTSLVLPQLLGTSVVEIEYLEKLSQWHRLFLGAEGNLEYSTSPADYTLVNRKPSLVSVIELQTECKITYDGRKPPKPQEIVRSVVQKSRDWIAAFRLLDKANLLDGQFDNNGQAVEIFLVSIIRALDVQVFRGMKIFIDGAIQESRELDVIAMWNGRIFFFDCKIGEMKKMSIPAGTQITDCSQLKRYIGGYVGGAILFRPTSEIAAESLGLARNLEVTPWFKGTIDNLFEDIEALFGIYPAEGDMKYADYWAAKRAFTALPKKWEFFKNNKPSP